jgi:hypothetical protein
VSAWQDSSAGLGEIDSASHASVEAFGGADVSGAARTLALYGSDVFEASDPVVAGFCDLASLDDTSAMNFAGFPSAETIQFARSVPEVNWGGVVGAYNTGLTDTGPALIGSTRASYSWYLDLTFPETRQILSQSIPSIFQSGLAEWSPSANVAAMHGAADAGRPVFAGSPLDDFTRAPAPGYSGESIYSLEYQAAVNRGYRRDGLLLLPP